MFLALGIRGPQTPALRHKAPWEGILGHRPRVRVRPQEAGRPDPEAVRRAEVRAKVRALASEIVGPCVLERRALEGRRGLRVPCPFSLPE